MQVGVKHPVSLAAFSVVVSRPSRAVGRRLVPGSPRTHAVPCPGPVTWSFAADRGAVAAADSPTTSGILSRRQVQRGAVRSRRRPDSVVRRGLAFSAVARRPVLASLTAAPGRIAGLSLAPAPACPHPRRRQPPARDAGPLRASPSCCARNREGAVGLPMGMSNNA